MTFSCFKIRLVFKFINYRYFFNYIYLNCCKFTEVSLIYPDFTISEYGSSCRYLFFGLILSFVFSNAARNA